MGGEREGGGEVYRRGYAQALLVGLSQKLGRAARSAAHQLPPAFSGGVLFE